MKLLCQHRQTRQHLEAWAGEAGKQLIMSQFFFWREGTKSQRSLSGLLRGLLYHMLDAAPELMPAAFPDLWELTGTNGVALGTIPDSQVEAAFNLLVTGPRTYCDHLFMFFIDGLDEFEGDYHQQTKMIERLFKWASVGNGHIKMCISSREWNIFLDAFSSCPKLRLQDLTIRDMRALISGRLSANKQYQARSSEFAFLDEQITMKAEGVFLWVYLVLNAIEQSLCDGADADSLHATLDLLPSDLEQLFEKLFPSIPAANMPSALQTFSAVLQASNTSAELLLYRYSFLDEYHKDKDFAIRMPVGALSAEQVETRLSLARRKAAGQCKGFLELRMLEDMDRSFPFREYVTMTHRSLVDYLRQKCASISEAESRDALLQGFLAQIKTMETSTVATPYFAHPWRNRHFAVDLERFLIMAFDYPDEVDPKHLSRVIDEVERCFTGEYWSSDLVNRDDRYPTVWYGDRWEWGMLYAGPRGRSLKQSPRVPLGTLVTARAAYGGSHEFLQLRLQSKDEKALAHISSGHIFVDLLRRMKSDRGRTPPDQPLPLSRWVRILDLCFRNGGPVAYQLESRTDLWSSWTYLVWYLILTMSRITNRAKTRPYIIMLEAFLRFGAKADIKFHITPSSPGLCRVSPDIIPEGKEERIHCVDTVPAARLAQSLGGIVSLRDLVPLWVPRHGVRLQVLIDGNAAGVEDCSGYWDSMVRMSDAQLDEELGDVRALFPNSLEKLSKSL